MKKNTRFAFNAYLQQLARLNGVAVEELSSKFTVDPNFATTMLNALAGKQPGTVANSRW